MKIHDNGFTPQAGETYWAAAFSYGKPEPIIAPVSFKGEAPYLELVTPPGLYHSEWWLLERCELPTAVVTRDDDGNLFVTLATHPHAEVSV